MRRAWARTALALAACLPAAAGAQTAASSGEDVAAALARLRELHALDLGAEIVGEWLDDVRPGGALARSGEAVALVAQALATAGDEVEAQRLLQSARPDASSEPWIALQRARLALRGDQLDRAIELLARREGNALAPLHPDFAESWLLLGRALQRRGQLSAAAAMCRRFVDLAPLHPEAPAAWHVLELDAISRRELGKAREHRAEKERLRLWHDVVRARRVQMRLRPEAPEPPFGLALAWMEVGEYARAEEILSELSARAAGYCRLWFQLGEARRLLGRADGALEAFDRGVECDPDDEKSRYQRAELRFRRGEREAAAADFEALWKTAVADDVRYRTLHLRLAQIERARGHESASQAHYARYRSLGGTEPLGD